MGDTGFDQSLKAMVSEKRGYADSDDQLGLGSKKPKFRDLDSVFRSEESTKRKAAHPMVVTGLGFLDLNASVPTNRDGTRNEISVCAKEIDKAKLVGKQEINFGIGSLKPKRFSLDLNAEDVSSSSNNGPIPSKYYANPKASAEAECSKNMGRSEERDSLRVWNEMKQNGFISSSHGGVPRPKPRGRKAKTDVTKQKTEILKRDQVDRFAKIAAPSGLLNGLNPGIINHVRNSKQVYSIIEALVKLEKHESCNDNNPGDLKELKAKEFNRRKSEIECINPERQNKSNQAVGSFDPYTNQQMHAFSVSTNRSVISDGDEASSIKEHGIVGRVNSSSNLSTGFEDDMLELKLSSSTSTHSKTISSVTCEESVNITNVSSFSAKAAAAGVASQWLELLRQDVEGRLAALRRSKKRAHEVIHTELPYLVSKEFQSTQDHKASIMASSVSHSNYGIAEAHHSSWGALFHRMDKALSEEEKQLENWLNQVKEMQSHCHPRIFKSNAATSIQQMDSADFGCGSEKTNNRALAVGAAAASIYSTCNLLSSMENLPCF